MNEFIKDYVVAFWAIQAIETSIGAIVCGAGGGGWAALAWLGTNLLIFLATLLPFCYIMGVIK